MEPSLRSRLSRGPCKATMHGRHRSIERDGKFYLYVPISVKGWPKNVIAVAVADNPFGPFKDALGHPLIDKANGNIDPTAFVDDDGQAYLYLGNPNSWFVKLNQDMISYSGEMVKARASRGIIRKVPGYTNETVVLYGLCLALLPGRDRLRHEHEPHRTLGI